MLLKRLTFVLSILLWSLWHFRRALEVQSYGKKAQSGFSESPVEIASHSRLKSNLTQLPRHIYWCGYPEPMFALDNNIGKSLFPEVHVSELEANSSMSTDDLLIFPCGGQCAIKVLDFPGKIVTFNGESYTCTSINSVRENLYAVSPVDATNPNITAYFVSMYLQSLSVAKQNKIYKPEYRPTNTKRRFLIYAASHCVLFRNVAFTRLSRIGPVEYAGHCRGHPITANMTSVSLGKDWFHNYKRFQNYRFALVMENIKKKGYITEKILNAFLAGCVPIYYGTEEVFDIFNRNAFIYYDVTNPRPALERIAYLEKNRTAYDLMLKAPILANGSQTIEKYFSWSDEVGGGQLKWKVRQLLGYD